MNTNVVELIVFGLVATIAGIGVIALLTSELAPARRQNWLLAVGLGAGVVTFGLKIGLILTISAFPNLTIGSLPERTYSRKSTHSPPTPQVESIQANAKSIYKWEALAESAPFPLNNPPTPKKITLGKKLFLDTRLSANRSVSCASCHELSSEKGGGDGLMYSKGIYNQEGSRNASSILNAAFQRVLFWDGRASSLEAQAIGPLTNPVEMGMPSVASVEKQVQSISEYQQLFAEVFPQESRITIDNITKAIAAYERTLITPDSPYDRFIKGDFNALSKNQLRGMALFENTGCINCHSGPNFSEASIYAKNTAYRIFPVFLNDEYENRYHFTDDRGLLKDYSNTDNGLWRVPSLRNVSRTAPYFHNGSVESLDEAVRIMAQMQLNKTLSDNPKDDKSLYWLDDSKQLGVIQNQALSTDEVDAIVAFLEALNGDLLGH